MSGISSNLFANSVYDKTAAQDDPWYRRYAVPMALAGTGTAALIGRRVAGKKVAKLLKEVRGLNPVGGPTDTFNRIWALPEGELKIIGGKPVNVGFGAEAFRQKNQLISGLYDDIAKYNQNLQAVYDLQKLQSALKRTAIGSGSAALGLGAYQGYKDKTSGVKSLLNRIGQCMSTGGQEMQKQSKGAKKAAYDLPSYLADKLAWSEPDERRMAELRRMLKEDEAEQFAIAAEKYKNSPEYKAYWDAPADYRMSHDEPFTFAYRPRGEMRKLYNKYNKLLAKREKETGGVYIGLDPLDTTYLYKDDGTQGFGVWGF